MKKTLLGLFAVAIAISASAFKPLLIELYVSASSITTGNVSNAGSYQETQGTIVCQVDLITQPCKLDLTKIPGSFGVTDEASFLAYLNNPSNFATPAARVAEVNRIAIEWKP